MTEIFHMTPDEATHEIPSQNLYYREIDGNWHFYEPYHKVWCIQNPSTVDFANMVEISRGQFKPRPGTICECQRLGYDEWQVVKIICEYQASLESKVMLWATNGEGGEHCFTIHPHANFRPIRTPEQIAAEEREREIEALATDIMGEQHISGRVMAERLHSLGYRKVEGGAQ